jgi:hypothetical protein
MRSPVKAENTAASTMANMAENTKVSTVENTGANMEVNDVVTIIDKSQIYEYARLT